VKVVGVLSSDRLLWVPKRYSGDMLSSLTTVPFSRTVLQIAGVARARTHTHTHTQLSMERGASELMTKLNIHVVPW